MPGIPTRLERLERATAEVRCVWLYAGWKDRGGITARGPGPDDTIRLAEPCPFAGGPP